MIRGAARPLASVPLHGRWCSVSLRSLFWLGFIVERELAQHGALAALVDEVGSRLVVVFSDGRHDGDHLSADPAVAGQADAPHSVLADGMGGSPFLWCQESALELRRGHRMLPMDIFRLRPKSVPGDARRGNSWCWVMTGATTHMSSPVCR